MRRIIALTGTEAREASHLAQDAQDELASMKSMNGKEKEKAAKSYLVVSREGYGPNCTPLTCSACQSLDSKDISQIRKTQLREAHTKLMKEMIDEVKASEKAESKKAVDAVTEFFTNNPNARVCVMQIDVGSTAKALQAAIQHIAKQYQRAAYLFSVDKEDGKVLHYNLLPKTDVSKQFNAKEWINAIAKIVGGRGGGKDDGAQGVGSEVGKVGEAIEEAKKLYEQAMGSL